MKKKEHGWEDLCGVTKLIFFLAWTITCMLTYDTRVLAIMLATSLILFKLSKTSWEQVGSVFKVILVFMIINILAIFIFAPGQGTKIYGTEHILYSLGGRWVVTQERCSMNSMLCSSILRSCRRYLCSSSRPIHPNLRHH